MLPCSPTVTPDLAAGRDLAEDDVVLLAIDPEDYPAQNDGEWSVDEPTPMNDLFSIEGDEHWIDWLMDCVAIESTLRGRH